MSASKHNSNPLRIDGATTFENLLAASTEQIASYVGDAHPTDAVVVISQLPQIRAAEVFEHVLPPLAAQILREARPELAATVCLGLGPYKSSMILSEMAPDDLVDILNQLPQELRDHVVQQLSPSKANEVRRLASYPADSAGGIMTTGAIALPETMSVEDAVAELRRIGKEAEQVYYVYAVDASGKLTGVLSMRDLIFAPSNQPLSVIKRADVVSVPVNMDQEDVARVLRRHRFLALPVVNDVGTLLGVITSDDLADVVEEEATDDIQQIGGTQALHAPYFQVGFVSILRKRGGWLAILFVGEMLTATAMGVFESEIQRAAMIALFVPLIISSGGNTGSQATTIIIRSLALREIMLRDWWRIASRELATGLVLGLCLGLLGALRIMLWHHLGWHQYGGHPYRMAATIWISLIGVVTFGSTVGSMLPMVMHRLHLDPATASAPFVATLVDVAGLVIYFVIAIAILSGTVL